MAFPARYQSLSAEKCKHRGNLHSHSTRSDGRLSPGQLVELYREQGYGFLCMSEHDCYTIPTEGEGKILLIPGTEIAAVQLAPGGDLQKYTGVVQTHHIGGLLGPKALQKGRTLCTHGEPFPPLVYQGEWDAAAVAKQLKEQLAERGCFAIYNHPEWSHTQPGDYAAGEFPFLEIYNHNAALDNYTGWAVHQWDQVLRQGYRVYGVAADDNHNAPDLADSCGGWVMVQAEECTHEAITTALLAGEFYASSGPQIHRWELVDGVATVGCSPVESVRFISGGDVGSGRTFHRGELPLTQVSYPLSPRDGDYIRVECVAADGTVAWSQPIFEEA